MNPQAQQPEQQAQQPDVSQLYAKGAPEGWMAELQAGNIKAAQEMLEQQMAQAVKPQIEQEILARTADVVRAELDTRQFVDNLKAQMPEVVPFEPYISAFVERRMAKEAASASTVSEYVEIYKKVVQEEMTKAREAIQQTRAAGKEEALQVRQEVLSASTVPKGQEGDKGALAPPQEPKPLSPAEYYAARMQQFLKTRGVSV